MKTRFGKIEILKMAVVTVMVAIFSLSCEDNTTAPRDTTAPPVPSGLRSTTGDGVIWLEWDPIIGVRDLDGYSVYRSTDDYTYYWQDDIYSGDTEYADHDVENGQRYYYGVSSFDRAGNESEVSFEYRVVFDTPRPQGGDVVIYTVDEDPGYSGFDFSAEDIVTYNSPRADFYLEFDPTLGINTYFIELGTNGAGIQDMGHTESLYDITYAPEDGWSQLGYAEAIAGHSYVIWTMDNHYAMIRVSEFHSFPARSMIFDWAYQVDTDNRELKIAVPSRIVISRDGLISEY